MLAWRKGTDTRKIVPLDDASKRPWLAMASVSPVLCGRIVVPEAGSLVESVGIAFRRCLVSSERPRFLRTDGRSWLWGVVGEASACKVQGRSCCGDNEDMYAAVGLWFLEMIKGC